jgi:TRAP-type C4-dicarboxylate transport system permease small subunit
MKSSIASFFAYLFMASVFVCLISALILVVILLRYFSGTSGRSEEEIAYYFFIILVGSISCAPISLYISSKLGRVSGQREEI